MTMTLVSSIQVGAGGAASIEFTGIPQTGTDLVVVYSLRLGVGDYDRDFDLTINGSTATIYNRRTLSGDGSSAGSSNSSNQDVFGSAGWVPGNLATANTFGSGQIYLPNYTSAQNKSFSVDSVSENNATRALQLLAAGSWASTAAITSIKLHDTAGNNWVQYSTASLYIVTKGSGGASVS